MSILFDRWMDFRDRLISDRRFQTWAASSIFTRRIARNRARGLFNLCAGFVYSQILSACVALDLFTILKDGAQTADELQKRIALPRESLLRLLDAAVSIDLVSRRSGNRFGLGNHGAALLANPGITEMIKHHALLYADLADPIGLLQGTAGETKLSRFWSYARSTDPTRLPETDVAAYTALMSASQGLVADDILDSYSIAQHRTLLDIGGGDGTFAVKAAERAPNLRVMVFDLPAVAARASARFENLHLNSRATAVGGDFTSSLLPDGADLVTLVRVIHDHDDKKVRILLAAIRHALSPGGTLLIAEPIAGTKRAEMMGDAYFGFYLMAMGSGRPRTFAALSELLCSAGFHGMRLIATRQPLQTSLVAAKC
jgi:demethylspheroidene O-methyltransferase